MKRILFILLFLTSFTGFSQDKNNKSFKEILKPYVERTLEGLEKGVEYATQEVPIVLKQYVMFEAIKSWVLIIISIIAMCVFVNYTIKEWRKGNEGWFIDKYNDPFSGVVFTIYGGIILGTVCAFGFFQNIFNAIQATFFSKLFLVQRFIELF